MSGAFENNAGLTNAIPENLLKNLTMLENVSAIFSGCRNLTGNIPETLFTDNTKITSFAATFMNCASLTGSIPEVLFVRQTENTSFVQTFKGCNQLSGMVPKGLFCNNSKVTNYQETFANCSGITAGEIQINTGNVTNMDNMFSGCTSLESLILGREFKKITGINMFKNCSALRAIILLNKATTVVEVGTIVDEATLGLAEGTIIYVPYVENEAVYETAWSGILTDSERKVEKVVQAIPPNPDYVGLAQEYIDPGYTVAGFSQDEEDKWKQYGLIVEVT